MKFKAFISYSSTDRIVGNRFHTDIERYKIPKALRGRKTDYGLIEKRIGAIFRDRTDLTASDDLGEVILDGLEQSEFLIVLCSPASAQSKWVNEEIKSFRRLGRGDNIIALIVSGVPSQFHPDENPHGAFAPALMQQTMGDGTRVSLPEPFAPDLREMSTDGKGGDGFDLAKLKVIARIIGIPMAELTQRQLEVERREKRLVASIAVTMMILAGFATVGGWLAVRQTREANARLADAIESAARQVSVASTYQDRFGVPTSVLRDLLNAADKDFSGLIDSAGGRANLVYQRGKLSLDLADFSAIVGDDSLRSKLLKQARTDMKVLRTSSRSLLSWLGLEDWPTEYSVDKMHLRLLDLESIEALSRDNKADALQKAEEALVLATRRASETKKDDWAVQKAARTCFMAETHYQLADYSQATRFYDSCVKQYTILAGDLDKKNHLSVNLALVNAQSNLAKVVRGLNKRERSRQLGIQTVNATDVLLEDEPDDTNLQRTQLVNLTWLGDAILADEQNPLSALVQYDKALAISNTLTNSDTTRIDWRRDKAIIQERRASAHIQTCDEEYRCDLTAARSAIENAIDLIKSLIARDPEQRDWQRDLSVNLEVAALTAMANVEPGTQNFKIALDDAISALTEAFTIRTTLFEEAPQDEIALHDLAHTLLLLGTHEAFLNNDALWQARFAMAEERYEQLLTLYEENGNDSWAASKYDLAIVHVKKFQIYLRMDDKANAQLSLERAEEILEQLTEMHQDDPQYINGLEQIKIWQTEISQ